MVNHEHSSFAFKVKGGVDDAGRFSGLLASFNTVDLGGDKILPNAFTKTIAGGKVFPLLWQHDGSRPIGSFTAKETQQGLQIEGQLLLEIQQAADCRALLRAGVLKGLSIGYDVEKYDYDADGIRLLKELRLWEGSVVTFPMSPESMVTSVKAMSDEERGKHLKAIDVHRRAIDKHQRAIRESLKCLFDGVTDEESPDDLALLENESEGKSALLSELKSLAAFASEFASA